MKYKMIDHSTGGKLLDAVHKHDSEGWRLVSAGIAKLNTYYSHYALLEREEK